MIGPNEIIAAIESAIPNSSATLVDLTGTANHWEVTVVSNSFAGKSLLQQHRMVYAALEGHVGAGIHALSIKTSIK